MFIDQSLMYKDQEITWIAEQSLNAGFIHGDWAECLKQLEQIKGLTGSDARIHLLRARALCSLKRFDEAETIVERLIATDYSSSGVFHCQGLIALNRGLANKSVASFSSAIEKNFGSFVDASVSDNLLERAKALDLQGASERAENDRSLAMQLEQLEKARREYLAGNYKVAEYYAKNLPGDLSEKVYVRVLIARCLIAENCYDEAIRITSKIFLDNNSCESAIYYRAVASFFAGDFRNCVRDLSHIIKEHYGILAIESSADSGTIGICDSIDGRLLRARANYQLGEFAQAMLDLDFIILRRPSWQAHLERSKSALKLSLFGTAIGDAQAACEINPANKVLQNHLKRCRAKLEAQNVLNAHHQSTSIELSQSAN